MKKKIVLILIFVILMAWIFILKQQDDQPEYRVRVIKLKKPFDERLKGMVVTLCAPPTEEGNLFREKGIDKEYP